MDEGGWRTWFARLPTRMWFRLALFTLVAVAWALVAGIVGRVVPWQLDVNLGQDSVQTILQIIATSMLAVTTFSLATMISAYSSAARVGTPRATQLLIEDPTSQNALSTFLGSFVFAIVGIVSLSTGYYGSQGSVILYFGTLVVVAVIVVTLLQWMHHLTGFGRMADIIDRVEHAALATAVEHARHPHLRAAPAIETPPAAQPVRASAAGVLTGINVRALQRIADEGDVTIHVQVLPGAPVDRAMVLAHVDGDVDDTMAARVARAFRVEAHRTYEQDPRLGFVALSEIASRALSPSVNDPGTAIEVLNALQRVMTQMLVTTADAEIEYAAVHVPRTTFADIAADAFRPVARDGAGMVEVGLRLQHVIAASIQVASEADAAVLRECSVTAERRSMAALDDDDDRSAIAEAAQRARMTRARG